MKTIAFAVLAFLALLPLLPAQVPGMIHYQGRIAVSGVNFTGSGQFKFALVNQAGTTSFWSNDGTSTAGSEPTAAVTLPVAAGLYSVLLGDSSLAGMTPVPATLFSQTDVRLRVWFNDASHGFQQLAPDQRIAAVGYAMMAANVPDAAITSAKIASGAVTGTQLAPGAAASNLNASGQSAVPSGGIVMSSNPDDATLATAGYVKLGTLNSTESDTWTRRPVTYAPLGRRGHCSVWTGSELVIFGGTNGVTEMADGGKYSPATNSWTLFNSAINRRAHASAVWTGSQVFVFGGEYQSGGTQYLADVAAYAPGTGVWTSYSVGGTPPSARSRHCTEWAGNDIMVIWGGRDGSNPGGFGDGARFNTNSWSWSPVSSTEAPPERHSASSVWTGTEMIVWGGLNGTGYPSKGGRYNPATDTWTAVDNVATPLGRIGHSAVWTGNRMLVWGGMGDSLYADGKQYDPTTDTWTALATSGAPSARQLHAAVWSGAEMLVWGGVGVASADPGAGARYNPTTQTWSPIAALQQPVARASPSAVWSGTEMIVWGGTTLDGMGFLNSGGRYNPTTNAWSAMPEGDPLPQERTFHTTVWTGSEMIIWGGLIPPGNQTNEGAIFRPATNTWKVISSLNAPTARKWHTAVWTGSEMVVWGGTQNTSPFVTSTGGRYNPTTDSWVPTTTAGAPSARDSHVAVWTGTEMIVLGGFPSLEGGRYNPQTDSWGAAIYGNSSLISYDSAAVWTGQEVVAFGKQIVTRYNPSTNTFQTVSSTNQPTLRYLPGMVWTGTEVLVWGGFADSSTYFNTGGRYNPTTNTWQTITTGGSPSARRYHSTIWTGSEMLVWGGRTTDGSLRFSDGCRYSPNSNEWIPLRAPEISRAGHSTVWTGSEMLIWGGDGTGGDLKDVYSLKPGSRLYLYQRP